MRIYFAAPLFSQAEREFNSKAAGVLRENGFDAVPRCGPFGLWSKPV